MVGAPWQAPPDGPRSIAAKDRAASDFDACNDNRKPPPARCLPSAFSTIASTDAKKALPRRERKGKKFFRLSRFNVHSSLLPSSQKMTLARSCNVKLPFTLGVVGHFGLAVRDPKKSAEWFARVLGLRKEFEFENGVAVGNDNVTIALFKGKPAPQTIDHMSFHLANMST